MVVTQRIDLGTFLAYVRCVIEVRERSAAYRQVTFLQIAEPSQKQYGYLYAKSPQQVGFVGVLKPVLLGGQHQASLDSKVLGNHKINKTAKVGTYFHVG